LAVGGWQDAVAAVFGFAPANRQMPTASHQANEAVWAAPLQSSPGMGNLLWLIIIILIIMWLGGFAFHIAGGLIHILLVIALILLIVRLVSGRRVL
jgi:uncharacterized protein DUF5670